MRSLFLVLITMGLLLSACGKNKTITVNLPVAYSWEAQNMAQNNASLCSGIYNNNVYFVEESTEKFTVRFMSFDGKERSSFEIRKGKGPGQALHSLGLRIVNDTIYFADLALSRISMFDMTGKFIDSIEYDNTTGPIVTFDIVGTMLYFHSINLTYLGIMDLTTGSIIKKIPYSKEDEENFKKDITEAKNGILKFNHNNNTLYFGNVSSPYRLDSYDTDLTKQKTYTYELESNIKPMIFSTVNTGLSGDLVIGSIMYDATHVYTTKIGGRFHAKSNQLEFPAFDGEILSFNIKTGNPDYVYTSDILKNMKGFLTILGVTDDYIVLHIGAAEDYAKILSKDNTTGFVQMIVVLKRDTQPSKT